MLQGLCALDTAVTERDPKSKQRLHLLGMHQERVEGGPARASSMHKHASLSLFRRWGVFCQRKGGRNPGSSESIGAIFPRGSNGE